MGDLLSVGIGGFLGAVLRFGLSGATARWTELTGFPIGTLGANLLGCFAIGLVAAYADQRAAGRGSWQGIEHGAHIGVGRKQAREPNRIPQRRFTHTNLPGRRDALFIRGGVETE